MSPGRLYGRKVLKSLPSTSTTAYVPPSELPEEIILLIIKRLPVKSILCFKCVSKFWISIISTPKFISMHRELTYNNPLNYSLIVRNFDDGKISLLNVNSAKTEPISLVIPSPARSKKMELVGSINGLVCLNCGPPEPVILLWNPAMNLYKPIRPPVDDTRTFLLGFAYDYVIDDYKIILVHKEVERSNTELLYRFFRVGALVYSSNLDSWKRVQVDFPFYPLSGNNVTAKGVPYWYGYGVVIEESNQAKLTKVFMYYDMQNGSFKRILAPKLGGDHFIAKRYVEWKGDLGVVVVSSPSMDKGLFIDILVYDEIGMSWNKISSHGPIVWKMERSLQWSKDWLILIQSSQGKFTLYDPVTNGIKELSIPGAHGDYPETFRYSESLVTIKGMEQGKEQNI